MKQLEVNLTIQQTLHEIAKFHYILAEGRKGNHLLFTPDMIRGTLAKDPMILRKLFQEKLEEINKTLSHTFGLPSFEEKRGYIASLNSEIQDALIFGYFQLLEGSDQEKRVVH